MTGAPKASGLIDDSIEGETQARLDTDASHNGLLSPDAPGQYQITIVDIIESYPRPSYAAEVVEPPSDNDETLWSETKYYSAGDCVRWNGYSYRCKVAHINIEPNETPTGSAATHWQINRRTYGDVTSYAVGDECIYNDALYRAIVAIPSYHAFDPNEWQKFGIIVEYWVYEELSRQFGDGEHTATLKIRTYDDRIIDRDDDPKAVVLTPGTSKVAKLASKFPGVLNIVDKIRDIDSDAFAQLCHADTDVDNPVEYFASLQTAFLLHIATATTWVLHNADDSANAIAYGAPATLESCMSVLNQMATKIKAHEAVVGLHNSLLNVIPTRTACTDLASALTLAD